MGIARGEEPTDPLLSSRYQTSAFRNNSTKLNSPRGPSFNPALLFGFLLLLPCPSLSCGFAGILIGALTREGATFMSLVVGRLGSKSRTRFAALSSSSSSSLLFFFELVGLIWWMGRWVRWYGSFGIFFFGRSKKIEFFVRLVMWLIKEFLLIDISYIFWNILGNFLYGILYLYSGKGKKNLVFLS